MKKTNIFTATLLTLLSAGILLSSDIDTAAGSTVTTFNFSSYNSYGLPNNMEEIKLYFEDVCKWDWKREVYYHPEVDIPSSVPKDRLANKKMYSKCVNTEVKNYNRLLSILRTKHDPWLEDLLSRIIEEYKYNKVNGHYIKKDNTETTAITDENGIDLRMVNFDALREIDAYYAIKKKNPSKEVFNNCYNQFKNSLYVWSETKFCLDHSKKKR